MFRNNYPRFETGVILKASMLQNLSLYQRNMLGMIYGDYSDGVLKGAGLMVENGTTIVIAPGIIKHNGMLYYMYEEERISVLPGKDMQYLKVRFADKKKNTDEMQLESSIVLEGEPPDKAWELELCRFVLNNGAVLRDKYRDLKDYSTFHDTVNVLEVNYSAVDGPTFCPKFLLEFGREMGKHHLDNANDVWFANECLKGENMKREIIERYICTRLGTAYHGLANQEIYRGLVKVADMARKGEKGNVSRGGRQYGRMLVD